MPKKPEVTSKEVASIAGRILKAIADASPDGNYDYRVGLAYFHEDKGQFRYETIGMLSDIRSLAASALTQAEDK